MTKTTKKKIALVLFYVLSWTWGFIMSFIGLCTVGVIKLYGAFTKKEYKLHKHGACYYLEVGKGWGGVELGMFFLISEGCGAHTKNHEHGHGLQNCLWGPLFPFVVCLPSATRYWLRECEGYQNKVRFSIGIPMIPMAVGLTLCILGIILPALIFLGLPLILYGLIIMLWLLLKETPKYRDGTHPPYDSIWFEGQATEWGTLFLTWLCTP